MTNGPEWHEIRAWTRDDYTFGFVPDRASEAILKLLGWLDIYLDALMDMVNQHCQVEPGIVMDSALSANEETFYLLERDGLLEKTGETGRYRLLWENLNLSQQKQQHLYAKEVRNMDAIAIRCKGCNAQFYVTSNPIPDDVLEIVGYAKLGHKIRKVICGPQEKLGLEECACKNQDR